MVDSAAPQQAHRSASRIGLVASGSSAKMCGPGKAPDQFARAFVRAGARTTPPPSRLAERHASLTRVGLHTRSTPGLPSMANATCISSAFKSTSSTRRANSCPLRSPVPAVRGYIFGYIHTGSRTLASRMRPLTRTFWVEAKGLEPSNLLTASQALYQLSYAPEGVRRTLSDTTPSHDARDGPTADCPRRGQLTWSSWRNTTFAR